MQTKNFLMNFFVIEDKEKALVDKSDIIFSVFV